MIPLLPPGRLFRVSCVLLLLALASCSRPSGRLSVRMAHSQIARCGDATYLNYADGRFRWNYATGLELRAYLDLADAYADTSVFNFARKWYDNVISEDGTIEDYTPERYSSDKISPGKALFHLYAKTGDSKYRKAIETVKSQIDGQPRTHAGAFWFKEVYPYQVWLDGVYMVYPFYVEYASRYLTGEERLAAYRDIVNGCTVAYEKCYDPETRLLRHAWDESGTMFWCDPSSPGQSFHSWGRALGWYCMGLIEVLEWLPKEFDGRERLIGYLREICAVLPDWADEETGLWYQVLDQPEREGNYLEASCSAMIVYTYLRGIREGYLDEALLQYAKKLYRSLVQTFVSTGEQGMISLEQCCSNCGLGGSSNRMGDFAYYISEPIRPNDARGVAPFIWASLERERLR